MHFSSEIPLVKDGKEWRVVRTLLKSEWRAFIDGAELRQLIPYRDSALLILLNLTAANADREHTAITMTAVNARLADNAKIVESNANKAAQRQLVTAEIQNDFWLAIKMCMFDVVPIRMEALKSAHAMTHPNPTSWVDGVTAFRVLEKYLVTDARSNLP